MAEVVLDASAILAMLRRERGGEQVEEVIPNAMVSVVNEAEVVGKLIFRGWSAEQACDLVIGLPYQVVDLDRSLARRAGTLWDVTKSAGLSLADRCCLALAERERLPVLTSDASWAKLSIGVDVRLIRDRPNA